MTPIDPVSAGLALVLAVIVGYLARRVLDALDDLRTQQRRANDLLAALVDGLGCASFVNQPTNQPTNHATAQRAGRGAR